MSVNRELAEIYGTNQPAEGDAEKLAAAELAEKLAAEGDLDVNTLSDEQAEELAAQVLAGDEKPEVEEPAAEEPEADPEAAQEEEKVAYAVADKMGRVMAHSFWQERDFIQKEAGLNRGALAVGAAREKAVETGGKVLKHIKSMGGKAKSHAGAAANSAKEVGKKHGKPFAAGAAAGGAAGAAAMKAKEKKSSAFETLAHARAVEILEENGIKLEEPAAESEKTSSTSYDVLADKVESAALELLKANGYTFGEPAAE